MPSRAIPLTRGPFLLFSGPRTRYLVADPGRLRAAPEPASYGAMTIPWFIKIPAKIVLSRLPVRYEAWRSLNLFRAGGMDDPQTAFEVYHMHCKAAGFEGSRNYTVLELGPGDSMLTALFARSAGAAQTILVDQSELATGRLALFAAAESMLADKGMPVPGVTGLDSISAVLERLNCRYLTGGLETLKALPDGCVDFVFSNAVIEHVRKGLFAEMARELYRVMAPGGVASHWIDYRDHLEMKLDNLRFSEPVWESAFMVNSGFYTNRMPAADIRSHFEEAGFVVEERDTVVWPQGLPTPQAAMSEPFASMAEKDLMVMTNWLLLRKRVRS
jgi:SAM-dependent methyltransferase